MEEAKLRVIAWQSERNIDRELSLSGLGLTILPILPISIKHLDCSNNSISEIIPYPNLRTLICSMNKITQIPSFDKLKKLKCDHNNLTLISPNLMLENLDCSHNKLKKLPSIKHVKILDCSFNNLTTIISALPEHTDSLNCIGNNIPQNEIELLKLKTSNFTGDSSQMLPPPEIRRHPKINFIENDQKCQSSDTPIYILKINRDTYNPICYDLKHLPLILYKNTTYPQVKLYELPDGFIIDHYGYNNLNIYNTFVLKAMKKEMVKKVTDEISEKPVFRYIYTLIPIDRQTYINKEKISIYDFLNFKHS